jgi:hypothetical protein
MVNYTTVSWPIEAIIPRRRRPVPEEIRKANP